MDQVAVLIPCYNEAQTIHKVVEDCKMATSQYQTTIYVYDNNSSDGSVEIAAQAGAVVRHEYQQGKGNVVRRMFREIDAQCYIMLDGDDTYPAEHIAQMAQAVLERNADMVVGDRLSSSYFTENKRPFHNAGNVMTRSVINFFFKSNVKDIMTGYRAFSYEFVKTFPVLSTGFEIETEMTIFAGDKNLRLENIVIDYRDRPEGSESKLNTFRDGFKVLRTIFMLYRYYKPLAFFSLVAVALVLVSIGVFVPLVLIPFLQTGEVERFPTLIVCGFMVLTAILSLCSGMILDTVAQKSRQEYESKLVAACNEKKRLLLRKKESHYA